MTSINETIKPNCSTEFIILPTEIRKNHDYILWYINISNLVVTGAIPAVLLTYLNYKIYKYLKTSRLQRASMVPRTISTSAEDRSRNEIRQTFVLFMIVILFVICHALRVILNIEFFTNLDNYYEQRKQGCAGDRFWAILALPISALLLYINSGTNFFIYCFCDNIFKEVLKSKLLKIRDFIYVQKTTRMVQVPRRSQRNLNTRKSAREDIELHTLDTLLH